MTRARVDTPPTVNTGGHDYDAPPVVVRDGRDLKIQTTRFPAPGHFTSVDSLRFTTKERCFDRDLTCVSEDHTFDAIKPVLAQVFGFRNFTKQEKGRDFYEWTWVIGDKECQLGAVSFGGYSQRGTVSIYLTGQGCMHADAGWEQRLYELLKQHREDGFGPSLTRIDIAHDDLEGKHNPRSCLDIYQAGGFDRLHNRPLVNQAGNWLGDDPKNKGLTFYVGTRYSSQLLRVYEKGKQLGDKESPWNRVEVQFSSHDRVLPLEMLIKPDEFFMGAYPVFQVWFGEWSTLMQRTELKQKTAEITLDDLVYHASRCYGALVNVMKGIGQTSEQIIASLIGETPPDKFPRRLAQIVPA
ncbi:MAG: hypothetical protein B7Y41_08070 [Hydrogenophilales bacterium 28-61-23]|nr:MAG: hypothetical protein B7Y41_08070 [Hydrogenophilales bacterium 28-61-23]